MAWHKKNICSYEWQIFGSLITVSFMALLPFLLLPYTLSFTLSTIAASGVTPIISMIDKCNIGRTKTAAITGYYLVLY
ncbi:hypothetical protein BH18THE2_BH18THE2_33930 [soil metagenome]